VIVLQDEPDPIFLPIVHEAHGHGDRSHEDNEGLRRFACWPLLPAFSKAYLTVICPLAAEVSPSHQLEDSAGPSA
jgi:hypothetical protein